MTIGLLPFSGSDEQRVMEAGVISREPDWKRHR